MNSRLIMIVLISVIVNGCASPSFQHCNRYSRVGSLEVQFIPIGARTVAELAEARARQEGIDLNEFQDPEVSYSLNQAEWTLFFEMKEEYKHETVGNSFTVSIDAFTGETRVFRGF